MTAAARLGRLIAGYIPSQAVAVAAELGIADLLATGPRTSEDLASELGVHSGALHRLLRALAGAGVFMEDGEGRFAQSELSACLVDGAPGSLRPWARLVGRDLVREPWGRLQESVRTGTPSFEACFGQGVFEHLHEHPADAALFQRAMTTGSEQFAQALLAGCELPSTGTLVDVGGGHGELLAAALAREPGLSGVLLETPGVADSARRGLAERGLDDRIEVVAGDFFEAVPPGADLYVLKWILHDWSDEEARRILESCRRAMSPHSRLLACERLVTPGNDPGEAKLLDLNMLVLHGGRERTRAEFSELFAAAGLELARVLDTGSPLFILEGRLPGGTAPP